MWTHVCCVPNQPPDLSGSHHHNNAGKQRGCWQEVPGGARRDCGQQRCGCRAAARPGCCCCWARHWRHCCWQRAAARRRAARRQQGGGGSPDAGCMPATARCIKQPRQQRQGAAQRRRLPALRAAGCAWAATACHTASARSLLQGALRSQPCLITASGAAAASRQSRQSGHAVAKRLRLVHTQALAAAAVNTEYLAREADARRTAKTSSASLIKARGTAGAWRGARRGGRARMVSAVACAELRMLPTRPPTRPASGAQAGARAFWQPACRHGGPQDRAAAERLARRCALQCVTPRAALQVSACRHSVTSPVLLCACQRTLPSLNASQHCGMLTTGHVGRCAAPNRSQGAAHTRPCGAWPGVSGGYQAGGGGPG
jgi:hypothetical protein